MGLVIPLDDKAADPGIEALAALVAADMNVADAHALTDEIEERIEQRFPGASVTAHIEPCRHLCTDLCRSGCLLPPAQQTPIAPAAR